MRDNDDLLTACELAGRLRRSVKYVYAMKKNGFLMPGGLATVNQALAFLARNPAPTSRRFPKVPKSSQL